MAGPHAGAVEEANQSSSSLPSSIPAIAARFEDLGLSPDVLRAVIDSGYTTPTPIQAQGIPQVLQGRDVMGIAQTGTGKTASFVLPMIEILARGRSKARMPRSLILEPTRELADQVAESFKRYGKHHKLSMALLIGGVSLDDQIAKLDRGVDVLIATPGRLLDLFERGRVMLSGVQVLVIDEADRMLDMGFIPDVERIAKLTPFTRQTLFYSATMPPEIQRLTEQFLHRPVRVEVSRAASTADTITQVWVPVPGGDSTKREALRRLIRENAVKNAIIFCNRKRDVDVVAKSLKKHGFSAAALHGDLDQSVRTRTLESFRGGEIQLLIASDVAARGLDIPAVSHIFNYDVPFHADDYVHRIGRTGRAGRLGHAYTLVGRMDAKNVDAIEKLIGKTLDRYTMEGLPEDHDRTSHHGRPGGHDRRSRDSHGRSKGHQPRPQAAPAAAVQTQPAPQPQVARAPEKPRHAASAPKPAVAHASDGERLPAFLLRPVTLPKPTKAARVEEEC